MQEANSDDDGARDQNDCKNIFGEGYTPGASLMEGRNHGKIYYVPGVI